MAEKFYPYDSAMHLETEEDIADYMEAVMEEAGDDPGFIAHALGIVARARNMSQLARDAGITREGLYKAFSADGNPSFATVAKVAGALGLRMSFKAAKHNDKTNRTASANSRRPAKAAKNRKRAAKAKTANTASHANAAKRRKVA
jgi:probable addiction module antidote protein